MICKFIASLIPRFGRNMNGDKLLFWRGRRWLQNRYTKKWKEV